MTSHPGLSGTVPVLPRKLPHPGKPLCPGEAGTIVVPEVHGLSGSLKAVLSGQWRERMSGWG